MSPQPDPNALVIRETNPLNAETPLGALTEEPTPTRLFYVRNHASIPRLDKDTWQLTVDGEVERPLRLKWSELREMPVRHVAVTLECAGNGRSLMARPVEGTAWRLGATGTAFFAGISLADVLAAARLRPEAAEILFTGADRGEVAPGRSEGYLRSLPREDALGEDVLLAWGMNGEELAREHGYPLRLVVPGWYGMASVKWLTTITALARPYRGYYQTERYVYTNGYDGAEPEPVRLMRVRSVVTWPADGERLLLAPAQIRGAAWSGSAPVVRVEISTDGGGSWELAELGRPAGPRAAVTWRFGWLPPAAGPYTIIARAADAAGNEQPLEPLWNRYGYGNNVAQRVRVEAG